MSGLRRLLLPLGVILTITACTSAPASPTPTAPALTHTPSPTSLPTATFAPSSTPTPTPTFSPSLTPYPTTTYSPALATAVASGECIQSFRTFAYQGPFHSSGDTILPHPPWQFEADLPPQIGEWYHILHTELARTVEGHQEIWSAEYFSEAPIAAIYQPISREWEVISLNIENTLKIGNVDLFTRHLYVTSDGVVWGQTSWDLRLDNPAPVNVPVLSRFNENTRQFELAQGVVETPLVSGEDFLGWPEILLDEQDIFWIVVDGDGIYRYDPATQATEKQADLPDDFELAQAVLSPDGSIYIARYRYAGETLFRLGEGILFQFFPDTGELVPLDIPDEEWPVFSGMLVDHTGRLWLGSTGYREPDGSWHLMHPHPDEYFNHLGEPAWSFPRPMLESSDGRLWYRKYLDMGGWTEGTAWYDPNTGEGCLFTNQAGIVIEDAERRLWLVADKKLYSYSLNP